MAAEMERQRLNGISVIAAGAAATGQLKVGEDECRDIVWSFTDGHLWHQLVVERGWSDQRYAVWLGGTWIAHLVGRRF